MLEDGTTGKSRRPGGEAGFSLLEILMAILLLSIAFVGLTAYSGSQRKALSKSGDLTEASQVAITALETSKTQFSDSAYFAKIYKSAKNPVSSSYNTTGKKTSYKVNTVVSRLSSSFPLLKVQITLTWAKTHTFQVGMISVQP
jgi:prepilin-type N-terminal cleavage/methylation domain-containing protein